jgi:hypothetical protein
MTKPEKLTLTNKLTGEVIDLEYSTLEEAEHAYLLVKSMTDTWERAQKRLVEYMGKQVEDKYQFADGATGQWVNPIRRRYRLEDVRKYLDEDQMAIVSEINGTKLKELLAQLVEDGHGLDGAWADIEANAESLPSKSYFKITKG